MRKLLLTTLCFCVGMHIYAGQVSGGSSDSTLRKTIGQYFLIGTTLNGRQIMGTDKEGCEIAASQFNAISPEGCMKIKAIHPEENRYDFTEAVALSLLAKSIIRQSSAILYMACGTS